MTEIGYCTVDDVRRALQEKDLDGALADASNQAVLDAITSQAEWLQETTNRHWYEPGGLPEDSHGVIATDPLTHTADEQDIPMSAILTADDTISPSTRIGSYTPVELFRRDVQTLTELLVLNDAGGFDDWVGDTAYTEGRGEDYFLQVDDADGWTTLYLDTDSLDDDDLTDYRNAVVASYEYGIQGVSSTVRRAVALRAGAQLVLDDDTEIGIPDAGQLVSLESKAQAMERQAEELLEIHADSR